jgi:hypothetical protein
LFSRTRGTYFTGADKDHEDLNELDCAELKMSPEELETKRLTVLNSLKLNLKEICVLERNTIDQVIKINHIK